MTIRVVLGNCRVEEGFGGWYVAHPSNAASVLAYTNTEQEAFAVLAVFDELSRRDDSEWDLNP